MKKILCFLGASLLACGMFFKENAYGKSYKISFIGDSEVGKTSVLLRILNNNFEPDVVSTIRAGYQNRQLLDGTGTNFHFWDTAGQERFLSLTPFYIRDSAVVVVMCSFDIPESIDHIKDWINFAYDACPNCNVIVVVNKNDLNDCDSGINKNMVSERLRNDIKNMGEEQIFIFDTSAVTGYGINELMDTIMSEATKFEIMSRPCNVNDRDFPQKRSCCK